MQEFFNKAVDLCTQAGGKVILALVVFIADLQGQDDLKSRPDGSFFL